MIIITHRVITCKRLTNPREKSRIKILYVILIIMRLRLRIARAIFLLSLAVILTAVFNEGLNSYNAYIDTRELVERGEMQTTRVVAGAILRSLRDNGLEDVLLSLPDFQSSTGAEILALMDPKGDVIAVRPLGRLPTGLDADFLQAVAEQPSQARWLQDDATLQVAVSIYRSPDSPALVVVREVDLSNEMSALRRQILIRIAITLLIASLFAILLLWLNWRWAVIPMQRIAAAASQATGGDYSPRLARMTMSELDKIANGFNALLDQVQNQTRQLETLNRDLESTVANRTAELRLANLDLERQTGKLNRQANGLQALNRILTAASTINHLQELVDSALREIVATMNADYGRLRILDAEAIFPAPGPGNPTSDASPHLTINRLAENGARSGLVVPVSAQNRTAGSVLLGSNQNDMWDEEDEALLNLIGQQLGAVAERIQAYEMTRETNRLMSRLISVSEQLNQKLDFEEMTAFIGRSALELSGAASGVFLLIDSENHLTAVWHRGVSNRFVNELAGRGSAGGVFSPPADANPVQIPDTDHLPKRQRSWWREMGEGTRSFAILPLVYEGRLSACLVSLYPEPGTPGLSHPEILEAFARQASIALENTRLFEAERQQRELAQALLDVSSALSATLDPDEIFERILTNLERVVRHDAASLMLAENGRLRVIRAKGYPADLQGPGRRSYPISMFPEVVRMSETGAVSIIPDTRIDPNWVRTPNSDWMLSYAGAPVRSRGTLIGVINLIGRQPGAFSANQAPILQAFAAQAALALENAKRYQETLRNLDEAHSLYQALTNLLSPGSDSVETARKIVETVTTQLSVEHCAVAVVERESNQLVILAQSGTMKIKFNVVSLDGPGITPAAVRRGIPIYAPDVSTDALYLRGSDATRSEFVIPLRNAHGQIIAVLNMESERINAFDDTMRQNLIDFAARAALVLENAQLLDTTRRRFEESEKLRAATAALATQLNFEQIADLIAKALPNLLRYDTMAAYILQDDALRPILAYNLPLVERLESAVFPVKDAIVTQLIETRQPVVLENAQSDPRFKNWGGENHIHSWIAVPLAFGEEIYGAIEVGRLRIAPFTPNEIVLLQVYANQIGVAMRNATMRETEQQIAMTDPLTGLYNRRGFFELARHELERSWRFYRPLGLLMADIDHFKVVNDTYGHIAGDAVLTQMAQTMRETLREVDLICRFGGEEFCVMLPESDPRGAMQAAERLRAAIEAREYLHRDLRLRVTISIGLAHLTTLNQSLEELIENADKALFDAKSKGRNRVCVIPSTQPLIGG